MDDSVKRDLVRRVKEGDEDAFTDMVNLYSDRIYNLALRILRRTDDLSVLWEIDS